MRKSLFLEAQVLWEKRWPGNYQRIMRSLSIPEMKSGSLKCSKRLNRQILGILLATLGIVTPYSSALKRLFISHSRRCYERHRILEKQPIQAYLNNIEGSRCLIECVNQSSVRKVVGVSTDKAAAPSNVYGATKYIMERMMLEADHSSNSEFVCVRFGNMINSRGSLISLWKNHPNKDEIKLTHPEVSRFFFSVEDGAKAVIFSLEEIPRGQIYIPKMKKAKIHDILKLITGRGAFDLIGLFPGEKIHEALLSDTEVSHCFDHGGYFTLDFKRINPLPPAALHSGNAEGFKEEELLNLISF